MLTKSSFFPGLFFVFLLYCKSSSGIAEIPFVVGGKPGSPLDFPYVVFVDMGIGFCTGSIIDPKWVLTAAHCTRIAKEIRVYAGISDKNETKSNKAQERVGIEYFMYPGYINPFGIPIHSMDVRMDRDYSLIKLDRSFDIDNKTVKLIELDGSSWGSDLGRHCTAVGFGTREGGAIGQLYFARVKAYHGWRGCPCYVKKYKVESSICFLSDEAGSSLCTGDSGGPLVCDDRQFGIASVIYNKESCDLFSFKAPGHICEGEGWVTSYLYICPVLAWIRSYVGERVPIQPSVC